MALASHESTTSPDPARQPTKTAVFREFQQHAACPKPKALSYAKLTGRDVSKRATRDDLDLLAWIADNADALIVDGETYAVVRMPAHMADKLATIGAALADLEPDTDLEHGADKELTLTEWRPDSPRQWVNFGEDLDASIPEAINQDFLDLASIDKNEDAEENGDREAVNEDGDPLDSGELDHADDEPNGDAEGWDVVGCPPETVARKRAIVAERRAAGEPRQRHELVATDPDGVEWRFVRPSHPSSDALPGRA